MKKGVDFYNKESAAYSKKRYGAPASNFIQFLFQKRLALLLKILSGTVREKRSLRLLEIGCADGYVLFEIQKRFPVAFSEMLGIDTAPRMIEAARKRMPRNNAAENIRFFVRDEAHLRESSFDIIVEVGVLNLLDIEKEIPYAASLLKGRGKYICSIAAQGSFWQLRHPGSVAGFQNFYTNRRYEALLREYFTIISKKPYGLFIPNLWKLPGALQAQHLFERVFSSLTPRLFHETIYLLEKKF